MNYAALLDRWNAFTMRVRMFIIGGVSLVIIVGIATAFLLHDNRVPLFAKALTADQVTEVDRQLSEWALPFSTTIDNVLVDRNQRNDLLLRLSMVGVPHDPIADVDTELAKIGALTPQPIIDAQTRGALEDDLALALRGVDGIADAHVIIAPATQAFFADDKEHSATASIRLTMLSGHTLSRDAIMGIRSFIANGVSGLEAAHVTVMDDRGMSLGDDEIADSGVAKDAQSRLQSALDNVFGPGETIVRVSADINKTAKSQYEYKNLPGTGAAISKVYTDERLAGHDRAYSKVHGTEDRGSQGIAARSEILPGGISRLTVAVFVDNSLMEQLPEIRELSAATAGIDATRGDVLTVAPVAFHHIISPIVTHGQGTMLLGRALPGLILGMTLVGILLVAMQPLLAILRRNANREILSQTKALEHGVDAASIWRTIHGEPVHVAAAVISQLPTSTAVAVLDMYPEDERREIAERLSRPIAPVLVDIVRVPSHA